jgi:hypothetical protein
LFEQQVYCFFIFEVIWFAHKLQVGVPKEEYEAEKMRSHIQWRLRIFADTMAAAVAPSF